MLGILQQFDGAGIEFKASGSISAVFLTHMCPKNIEEYLFSVEISAPDIGSALGFLGDVTINFPCQW